METPRAATALRRWPLPAFTTAATVAVALVLSVDDGRDAISSGASATGDLPWAWIALALCLPLMAVAHYVFAAVALRAASGSSRPITEVGQVQVTAAALNRVVPGGAGAIAVNARYLSRSGLRTSAAMASLGALGLVGAAADLCVSGAVTAVGPAVGITGAAGEVASLARHGVQAGRGVPWPLLALVLTAVACVVIARARGRSARPVAATSAVRDAARHLATLVRRPRRLLLMAAASGATTAVLALAFAATVSVVTGAGFTPPVGALLATYFVGAAVGGAAPLPAVFGVTEATLVAALSVSGVPLTQALVSTLLFRAVTFWAALPVGILAGRRLRAAALL